mmetsp:Transcript_39020/g.60801  ORF Transcript_39020/g.60801 Transcript_39020/m.60801 type:complete len:81 (+) Transcript_39020:29-271(+)
MEIIRLLMGADPSAAEQQDNIGFRPVDYATIELKERMGVGTEPKVSSAGGPAKYAVGDSAEAEGEGADPKSQTLSRCSIS